MKWQSTRTTIHEYEFVVANDWTIENFDLLLTGSSLKSPPIHTDQGDFRLSIKFSRNGSVCFILERPEHLATKLLRAVILFECHNVVVADVGDGRRHTFNCPYNFDQLMDIVREGDGSDALVELVVKEVKAVNHPTAILHHTLV